MESLYIYFLSNLILFLLYSIVVTIFGFFIFTLINNDFLKKKISLTLILKSFAIGLSLHLCYVMIIVSFRVFNFFTAYLPFMIFDAIFLTYIYFRTDIIKNRIYNLKKTSFLNFLNRNKTYILILVIAFIMQVLLQLSYIDRSIAIPGKDAYFYFRHIWFLHEYGELKYHQTNIRPPGYILMCGTITSIIDDYYVFYFFIKYIPIFLMFINVLVMFIISKNIFKKKINIFFVLTVFLGFDYFFSRNIIALPSNLAVTFVFLFLLFFNKSIATDIKSHHYQLKTYINQKLKDKNLIFRGIILAGIFMAHLSYFIFFLLCYLFYEILLLTVNLIQKRRVVKENLKLLFKFFIVIFSVFLYTIIFCVPAFICVSSYSTVGTRSLLNYFFYFFPSLEPNNLIIYRKPYKIILGDLIQFLADLLIKNPIYVIFDNFFKDFLFELNFLQIYRGVYTLTIGWGIFFIVFGVFIKYRKYFNFNEKQNYLINFIRFTFIFTVLFITVVYLMEMIKIPIFQEIVAFYNKLGRRLLELFPGLWAIIFVFGIDYIFILTKKLYFKINKTKVRPSKRLIRLFKISQLIILSLLSGVIYITNFKRVSYGTYHDYARAEALLFVGNYFNEHPLEEETKILLEDLEDTYKPYYILEYKNLDKKIYNFTEDEDYDDFKDYFDDHDCKYILLPKYLFDENDEFMEDFEEDFDKIYENSKFIFAIID